MFFLDQGQRLAVVGCGRAPSSRFPVAAAPVWRCPAAHPCCCCPADFTSRFLASPAGPLRAASRSYLQPTRYPAHTPDSPPQTQARARLPTCPQPPVLIAASPGSHALIFWAGGGDGAMRHDHHSLPVLATRGGDPRQSATPRTVDGVVANSRIIYQLRYLARYRALRRSSWLCYGTPQVRARGICRAPQDYKTTRGAPPGSDGPSCGLQPALRQPRVTPYSLLAAIPPRRHGSLELHPGHRPRRGLCFGKPRRSPWPWRGPASSTAPRRSCCYPGRIHRRAGR